MLQSYAGYLKAKVQADDFVSWGVGESWRKQIAEHQELEQRYLRQMAEDRAAQTADFKRRLGE